MSEVVMFRSDLQKCIQEYDNMVKSLSGLPEDMLVSGAFDYAKTFPDPDSNPWVQALSVKYPETAEAVRGAIESGNIPGREV